MTNFIPFVFLSTFPHSVISQELKLKNQMNFNEESFSFDSDQSQQDDLDPLLPKEAVSSLVSEFVDELYGDDVSNQPGENPTFAQFHGFSTVNRFNVLFEEHPVEFAYLLDLLDINLDLKVYADLDDMQRMDYIKEHIAMDVEALHDAETVALVSELSNDPDLSMSEKIDILADKYACYDELRRLAAMSYLILFKGFDLSLLDYFDATRRTSFSANRDRISFDKSKKLEKEADKAEAFHIKSELIVSQRVIDELLER